MNWEEKRNKVWSNVSNFMSFYDDKNGAVILDSSNEKKSTFYFTLFSSNKKYILDFMNNKVYDGLEIYLNNKMQDRIKIEVQTKNENSIFLNVIIVDDYEDSNMEEWIEEKQIKKYGEFMNEKYKLIISDEPTSDFNSDDWLMKLDISKIWKQYESKKINNVYFLQEYKKYLLSKKEQIVSKVGEECWEKINSVLEDFDTHNQESFYKNLDKLYDIGDKYGIKIET